MVRVLDSQCKDSNTSSLISPVRMRKERDQRVISLAGDFPGWGQCFKFPSMHRHCWLGDRKGIQSLTLKSYLPEQLGGKKTEKNS